MGKFFLTTAIPYVNGRPHIGHALEYFQADTVRRYHQLKNEETLLLSGSDENALKNVQAAEKEGISTQDYLDKYSQIWKEAYEFVGVKLDVFQRGSDQTKHWPGVQKLWQLCAENDDIYKKKYEGLYCVGCESFKTETELSEGLCPEHQKAPVFVSEENYFFRLSKYQSKLVELIENNTLKITPANKRAETLAFIKAGLEDFSVSRSNERAQGVGVPVPNDPNQKIYVWFDALDIYMTGVGFGWNEEMWQKWWPADLHIIGKDINRFHTVYWPAMLLSAGLPLPKEILIHSFVLSNGQKMSKSIGNVIDPYEIINKYGLEPVRYYMLSQIPTESDGDITYERFEEVYSADLANGIGNLISRVAKLCEKNNYKTDSKQIDLTHQAQDFEDKICSYDFAGALSLINHYFRQLDIKLSTEQPWKITDQEQLNTALNYYVNDIIKTAKLLRPFMPETASKILSQFSGEIKSSAPLFPRITS